MKINVNYKRIVTQSDCYKSNASKADLIYLIRKFLLNEDGLAPTKKELQKFKTAQLKIIWWKNKPRDLYSQFHYV